MPQHCAMPTSHIKTCAIEFCSPPLATHSATITFPPPLCKCISHTRARRGLAERVTPLLKGNIQNAPLSLEIEKNRRTTNIVFDRSGGWALFGDFSGFILPFLKLEIIAIFFTPPPSATNQRALVHGRSEKPGTATPRLLIFISSVMFTDASH